jgi:hypothetical protein
MYPLELANVYSGQAFVHRELEISGKGTCKHVVSVLRPGLNEPDIIAVSSPLTQLLNFIGGI